MWEQLNPATALVAVQGKYSRTISSQITSTVLPLPQPTLDEAASWARQVADAGPLEVGGLAYLDGYRIDYANAQAALDNWLLGEGLGGAETSLEANPICCVGSGFHHDIASFSNQVFGILWLTSRLKWDLYFPHLDIRVPLQYGTLVLFDSSQVHGVVRSGESVFDSENFDHETGVFISRDLYLTDSIKAYMGITCYDETGADGFTLVNQPSSWDEVDGSTGAWQQRRARQ